MNEEKLSDLSMMFTIYIKKKVKKKSCERWYLISRAPLELLKRFAPRKPKKIELSFNSWQLQ